MYQHIEIIGNLGRDPEMRYTPSGQAITSFSVAVTEQFTSANGEKKKRTLWMRVNAWGKQAEVCNQYLKKGKRVFVSGRLNFDEATGSPKLWDKKDGSTGTSFEMTAEKVLFLSQTSETSESVREAQPQSVDEGDIPF